MVVIHNDDGTKNVWNGKQLFDNFNAFLFIYK